MVGESRSGLGQRLERLRAEFAVEPDAIAARVPALLVDDEPVAGEGLRLWLASEPDVTLVGEAGSPRAAVALILREQPDLVFLDIQSMAPCSS